MELAQRILFNITAGTDLTVAECETVAEVVRRSADPDASIVFGAASDPRMRGELRVTLVATTFHRPMPPGPEPPWPSGVPCSPRPRTGGEGAMARPERPDHGASPPDRVAWK